MGYYINQTSTGPFQSHDKMAELIINGDAVQVGPTPFAAIPEGKALLGVKDNGAFQAVGLLYSEREIAAFCYPGDTRPTFWLLMDKALAHRLADFDEEKYTKTRS